MFYIRPLDLIYIIAESLYPFANLSVSHLPAPGDHFSTLLFYELDLKKNKQ